MREKLMYTARKWEKREREEGIPADFHSRSYHRYFKGYTEVKKRGTDGKVRLERVYTGLYHIQDLPPKERLLLRAAYVLLLIFALLLFLAGAAQNVGSNRTWYVAAGEAVSVAGIFWIGCALVNYLTAPRRLTDHEYRTTSGSIRRAGLTAACGLFTAFVLTVIYTLTHLETFDTTEIWCAASLLLSSALCALLREVERRVPYTEEYSDEIIPEGGIEID